jgi:hypothetical protein
MPTHNLNFVLIEKADRAIFFLNKKLHLAITELTVKAHPSVTIKNILGSLLITYLKVVAFYKLAVVSARVIRITS